MRTHFAFALAFMIMALMACGQADRKNTKSDSLKVGKQDFKPTVISVADFQSKMKRSQAQILDVRTDEEIADGFIAGAIQMDVLEWDSFVIAAKTLNPLNPVLVYCRSGGRSHKAATYLSQNGFTEVYDLDGGITTWNANDGKTVKP